jgi:hypothetical protein
MTSIIRRGQRPSMLTGSTTLNVDPFPTVLDTSMCPPSIVARRREM